MEFIIDNKESSAPTWNSLLIYHYMYVTLTSVFNVCLMCMNRIGKVIFFKVIYYNYMLLVKNCNQ